jgi:hypothetical protein
LAQTDCSVVKWVNHLQFKLSSAFR